MLVYRQGIYRPAALTPEQKKLKQQYGGRQHVAFDEYDEEFVSLPDDWEPPATLYHGTSLKNYEKMKADGFVASLLYLGGSDEDVEMYARFQTDDLAEPGVILHLDTETLLQKGQLMPDWDDVETNMEVFEKYSVDDPEGVSWQESLKELDTCSYKGPFGGAIKHVQYIE